MSVVSIVTVFSIVAEIPSRPSHIVTPQKLPPDPLLEAVAKLLTPEKPEWSGTPTELLEQLPGVKVPANVLTRKLNVSADRLYNDSGIRYESRRTHEGRMVNLKLENSEA